MDATDAASRVLARGLSPGKPQTFAALSEEGNVPLTTLYNRAQGRQSKEQKAVNQQILTPQEENAVVEYLLRMSNDGFPIPVKHVPSIALIVLRQRSSIFQTPASDMNIKAPGKKWTEKFFKRHPKVHPRRRKPMDWKRHDKNIFHKMEHWFELMGEKLNAQDIELGNVYNMDETGTMLCRLNTTKVVVGKDDIRDYRGAELNRDSVSAIECISGEGKLLNPMIIWPAASHRAKWTTHRTAGWHYGFSDSGYTDSVISLEWLRCVFDPQTRARAQRKPRILIVDGFKTHETIEAIQYCLENNIHLCRLPSHTSHKLQPCDVGIFSPLKTAYRDLVEQMYRGGLARIGKEHFTYLYSRAREVAFTSRNIRAGWLGAGLIPFNPDRVMSKTPKPPPEDQLAPKQEVSVVPRLHDVPHTPVTAEALTSLRSLIEQDIDVLDELSKSRVLKLANAAEKRFAECAILLDENKHLFEQNSESKVRKSTRSTVIGKARVMSWEDLERAKAKRAAKDQAAEDKRQATANKKQAAEEKKKATAERKKVAAAERKQAAEEKKRAAAERKEAAAEKKRVAAEKREAAAEKKRAKAEKKLAAAGKKRNEKPKAPEVEEATTAKKPHGRKRKRSAEVDTTASPKAKVARVSDESEPKAPVALMSEAQDPARTSAVQLTEAQEIAVQALAARMAEAQAAEDEIAVREMEGYCSVLPSS